MGKKLLAFLFVLTFSACSGQSSPNSTTVPPSTVANNPDPAGSGTSDPTRILSHQEFMAFQEANRLDPIPCFDGSQSPPAFFWTETAVDGKSIKAYVSQDQYATTVSLKDGDSVVVTWCGTQAEVGKLVIRTGDKGVEVLIDLYKQPVILKSSADLPSWPSPAPTATPAPDPFRRSFPFVKSMVKTEFTWTSLPPNATVLSALVA